MKSYLKWVPAGPVLQMMFCPDGAEQGGWTASRRGRKRSRTSKTVLSSAGGRIISSNFSRNSVDAPAGGGINIDESHINTETFSNVSNTAVVLSAKGLTTFQFAAPEESGEGNSLSFAGSAPVTLNVLMTDVSFPNFAAMQLTVYSPWLPWRPSMRTMFRAPNGGTPLLPYQLRIPMPKTVKNTRNMRLTLNFLTPASK